MQDKAKRIIELKAQYRLLSELEEFWKKPSNHRVYLFVQNKMKEIIKEIESLKK